MGWYLETVGGDEYGFQKRAAISYQHTDAAAGEDVTLTIPANWDDFWDTVDTAGYEIRITDSAGEVLQTWEWSVWLKSSRAGDLKIQGGVNLASSAINAVYWLYYDAAGAINRAGTATLVTPETGIVHLADPAEGGGPVVAPARVGLGSTEPEVQVAKTTNEEILVWFDLTDLMEQRRRWTNNEATIGELPANADVQVLDAGVDQSAMYDIDLCRWYESADGRIYFGAYIQAGADGTDYTIVIKLWTRVSKAAGHERLIDVRATLQVRDPETA